MKVRLLRFFVYNTKIAVSAKEIRKRLKISSRSVGRELRKLVELGLIKESVKSGKKYFTTDKHFVTFYELKNLVTKSSVTSFEKLGKRMSKVGKIKLLLVAGIFINSEKSRVDLLVVGDDISQKKIQRVISNLEAEIGHELNYAIISTTDFWYRYNMFDRFLRDIFEMPHEVLIKKIKY